MNNDEEFLQADSGISLEEQREIIAQINGITEKNRSRLSKAETEDKKKNNKAKKTGAVFPLSVNFAALIIIIAGAALLISFNIKTDAQARTGSAYFNLTERALVEEIRRDTAEKIAAKDREILSIASLLEELDTFLINMQKDDETTASEQVNTLLSRQRSFRDELSVLQDERAQILEESRSKEEILRARLQNSVRQDPVVNDLEQLSDEKKKLDAIEAQFSGGLAVVSELIWNGQYTEASQVLENLRIFNNTNSLYSSRSYQTRKEFYDQSINSLEMLIRETQKYTGAYSGTSGTDDAGLKLIEENTRLEETITGMQITIDALNSGSEGQALLFSELQASAVSLRGNVSRLETTIAERDRAISSLQTANTGKDRTITALESGNAEKDRAIRTLEAAAAERDRTVRTLETGAAERDRTIRTLETNAAERDRTIRTLETNAAERDRTISALETERNQLNQTINGLQTINSQQQQEITGLKNQIETIRKLLE